MAKITDSQDGNVADAVLWIDTDACKTGFTSEVTMKQGAPITGGEGKKIGSTTTFDDGVKMFSFGGVESGATLKWEVTTSSEDQAKGDRANLVLAYLDQVYIARLATQYVESLSETERDALTEDELVDQSTSYVMTNADMERIAVPIFSDTFETGGDGKASGIITFDPNWPAAQYFLTLHYGYSYEAERPEDWGLDSKQFKFWVEDMGTLVAEGIMLIGCLATGPLAGACAIAVTSVALGADIAIMYHQIQRDGWGAIDLNKYGCSFPADGGYNHTYHISYKEDEQAQDAADATGGEPKTVGEKYGNLMTFAALSLGGIGLMWFLMTRLGAEEIMEAEFW
jgi:hypothetical protein